MKPVISVIIPIYESEKFLSKCVESVLSQTFKDFELILVDDGSKDKSGEICDYYAKIDNRVIVIHKSNSGANASRIVGVNRSQGDYIFFVDSDDMLSNMALEALYSCFLYNNIDIAVGSMQIIHNNKTKVSYNDLKNGVYDRVTYIKSLLKGACHIGLHSKLYKRTVFTESVFALPDTVRHHEDLFMNVAIAANINYIGVFNEIQAYIYIYQNLNSVSRSTLMSMSEFGIVGFNIRQVLLKSDLWDSCIGEFTDYVYSTIYNYYVLQNIPFIEINKLKHDLEICPRGYWLFVEILNNNILLRRIFLLLVNVKRCIIKYLVELKHLFEK